MHAGKSVGLGVTCSLHLTYLVDVYHHAGLLVNEQILWILFVLNSFSLRLLGNGRFIRSLFAKVEHVFLNLHLVFYLVVDRIVKHHRTVRLLRFLGFLLGNLGGSRVLKFPHLLDFAFLGETLGLLLSGNTALLGILAASADHPVDEVAHADHHEETQHEDAEDCGSRPS